MFERTVNGMADWQIEQVAVGIAVLALFIHLAAWSRLCDRVTRLEALVKLLENEIIVIHKKEKDKEVSPELAEKLDKKYNFDGGVYYEK
jgi:hypothetical protein